MSAVHLPVYIENASYRIERLVPELASGRADWRQVQSLCTWFRQRGVCSLLLDADPHALYRNLMQSAAAFLHHLSACDEDGKVTSQAKPLFDALGGGYLDAARSIARASRRAWNRNKEYEDDFLYIYLLNGLLIDPEAADLAPTLARLEVAAKGKEPTRLALCQALLARDVQAFDDALAQNLAERVDIIEGMVERGTLSAELATWMRHFAGEGFALVRLAEALGMQLPTQYLHVPSAARPLSPLAFDPGCWRRA
ncbi:MAG: hypothetical protein U5L05_14535 [Rubrivivax sp.]|nr:hypothetical protein [Rubrivivax sp.]